MEVNECPMNPSEIAHEQSIIRNDFRRLVHWCKYRRYGWPREWLMLGRVVWCEWKGHKGSELTVGGWTWCERCEEWIEQAQVQ